nr:Cleavage and polyadenylation specificity factor subunit 2 [Ipomoea batatas]
MPPGAFHGRASASSSGVSSLSGVATSSTTWHHPSPAAPPHPRRRLLLLQRRLLIHDVASSFSSGASLSTASPPPSPAAPPRPWQRLLIHDSVMEIILSFVAVCLDVSQSVTVVTSDSSAVIQLTLNSDDEAMRLGNFKLKLVDADLHGKLDEGSASLIFDTTPSKVVSASLIFDTTPSKVLSH